MEVNNTMTKIRNTCHIITVLLKISKVVCYVGIGFLLAAIVYIALKGDLTPLYQAGKITVMAPISADWFDNMSKASTIFFMLIFIIKLIVSAIMFHVAGKFFGDAGREETPFVMKNVYRLRVISILYFVVNMFELSGSKMDDFLSINLGGFVGAFIIWGISYMFEYGCKLQVESDETL